MGRDLPSRYGHAPIPIHLIGDGDISIYVGFVVSGLVYYVLTRQPIRAAASAAAAPEPAGGPGLAPGAQPATDQ